MDHEAAFIFFSRMSLGGAVVVYILCKCYQWSYATGRNGIVLISLTLLAIMVVLEAGFIGAALGALYKHVTGAMT